MRDGMLTVTRRSSADRGVWTTRTPPSADPWWSGPVGVFLAGFVSLLTLLLVRNHGVFTERVYPRGDSAANAIITEQAKHFDLLVGNYSRIGFSHPGPAFFYWRAAGEWFFHDLLGLVPAPWNGQWLAVLVLNAALAAAALAILRGWSESWPPVAWCGVVALVFLATHDNLLSSTWMPYVYVAPFLLFLTAATSVAAGRTAHLWAMALAGGLLVHGHAEFLYFVPLMSAVALGAALWRRAPSRRRDWLASSGVVAAFLLPIVVNLVLHWPGEFGEYFSYGGERDAHGAGATARYVLGFWPGHPAVAVILVALLVAGLCRLALSRPPGGARRRFLLSGLAMGGLATLLFAGYAARGIDDLSQEYVGYFSWAVPLFLLLLAVLGLDGVEPGTIRFSAGRAARVVAGAAVVVTLLGAGWSPAFATEPENLPDLPHVVGALAQYAGGRPLVAELEPDRWPVLTALIVEGHRDGLRVCARDRAWRFMVTAEFVCTDRDVAEGRRLHLGTQAPANPALLTELEGTLIWS
jgi:hypothetical protein